MLVVKMPIIWQNIGPIAKQSGGALIALQLQAGSYTIQIPYEGNYTTLTEKTLGLSSSG